MRLDLQTFLPRFAVVKGAETNDTPEAYGLCADVRAGEIVVFAKAYVDFEHLFQLDRRGVFWVSRNKDNMVYEIVGQHEAPKGGILLDAEIKLTGAQTQKRYLEVLRLVVTEIEVDGKMKVMSLMTNNRRWAANSICKLYKTRWGVEVFFKQLKQTLQLADFLGHNENAVPWQI